MNYQPYAFFLFGVVARVLVPYLIRYFESGEPFNSKYLWSQLLAAFVALIPLVAVGDFLEQLGALAWLAAFAYGWFASDIGREAQKAGKVFVVQYGKRQLEDGE